MKAIHYHISLYVIIPAIFSGYATLCSILSYQLTKFCFRQGIPPHPLVFWAILIAGIIGFLCGLVIVWIVLKPTQEFIQRAQAVLPQRPDDADKKPEDPLKELDRFFRQVTSVLSMVDARNLFPDVIAESEEMRSVLSQITKVAPTDSTVLITGESGTGKELISTSIHKQSHRHDKPFIKLNCVAIPEGLWESELFGHEKGAFTGATAKKLGKFELANSGTLFLDEIGDMPIDTQAKLLRVLQEREFERVGGTRTIKVDVRFIAATNKNLERMVKAGTFREDLYFRLNVISIRLPPLRERRDDIPILAEHFCEIAPKKATISPMAMRMLVENSDFPGNVRELQNIVERAAVMSEDGVIEPYHLPENLLGAGGLLALKSFGMKSGGKSSSKSNGNEKAAGGDHADKEDHLSDALNLDDQMGEIEKSIITEALRKTEGIQKQAAQLLGIKERSLWHRLKKYEIDAKSFKKMGN